MSTQRFIIYCHTHVASGRKYVGLTQETMERRWTNHLSAARTRQDRGGCRYFNNAIRAHGAGSFTHEVLEEYEGTRAEADVLETRWIAKLDCRAPNGFNLAEGGKTSSHHPLSKQKMHETALAMGQPKRSARAAQGWASQTPQERTARSRKLNAAKKPEEFQRHGEWVRQEWAGLPEEEKAARLKSLRCTREAYLASLTPEKLAARSAKTSVSLKAKTKEEWAEISRHRRATRVANNLPRNPRSAESRAKTSRSSKTAFEKQPTEQRERVLQNLRTQTPEQLRANSLKGQGVRRAKKFRAKAHAWFAQKGAT
jgi:hypothetical protein